MKSLRFFILFVFSFFILLKIPTLAQTVKTVTSSEFFSIELSSGTQSPWTQKVPITIKFRANRNAEKTEISWDAPSGVRINEQHPQFVSVEDGQVYTYTAVVTPERSGTYNIAANVTAWELNTNYTSSSNISLKFDDHLLQDPPAEGYSMAVLIKNVVLVLFAAVGLAGAFYALKLAFNRLKEWLRPPE